MATKKEQLARMKAIPLYWEPLGRVSCYEHKTAKGKKMPLYEAWNYHRKCDTCGRVAGQGDPSKVGCKVCGGSNAHHGIANANGSGKTDWCPNDPNKPTP